MRRTWFWGLGFRHVWHTATILVPPVAMRGWGDTWQMSPPELVRSHPVLPSPDHSLSGDCSITHPCGGVLRQADWPTRVRSADHAILRVLRTKICCAELRPNCAQLLCMNIIIPVLVSTQNSGPVRRTPLRWESPSSRGWRGSGKAAGSPRAPAPERRRCAAPRALFGPSPPGRRQSLDPSQLAPRELPDPPPRPRGALRWPSAPGVASRALGG